MAGTMPVTPSRANRNRKTQPRRDLRKEQLCKDNFPIFFSQIRLSIRPDEDIICASHGSTLCDVPHPEEGDESHKEAQYVRHSDLVHKAFVKPSNRPLYKMLTVVYMAILHPDWE